MSAVRSRQLRKVRGVSDGADVTRDRDGNATVRAYVKNFADGSRGTWVVVATGPLAEQLLWLRKGQAVEILGEEHSHYCLAPLKVETISRREAIHRAQCDARASTEARHG